GVGWVGVFVPGLPTTVFLLIASWCFARSCPWLTEKLIHNRVFGPFVRYLEPGAVMPLKARVISLAMMWTAIVVSCWWVSKLGAPWFVPGLIGTAGLAGTWFIARQGRGSRGSARERTDETGARTVRHGDGRRRRVHTNGAWTKPTAPPSTTP
ncbi:MAG: YbaN family protein, partial [Planctomycetota bacterium]